MQLKKTKGLKPIIISYLAVLISICYMMSPLQVPINKLLHEVSHSFEAPMQIISHNSTSNTNHKSIDHFASDHNMGHHHDLMDFVNEFFEASSDNHGEEESFLNKINIDKHITTNNFELRKPLIINTQQTLQLYVEQTCSSYIQRPIKPPQLSII